MDADVVSHFITADEADAIHLIFPENRLHILDKVHAELQRWPSKKVQQKVSDLLSSKKIRLLHFPEDDERVKREYLHIKWSRFLGDGESACLAVARYQQKILASSNLRDISNYCSLHKIDYLTTMDFLCHALSTGAFTEERCNEFIKSVLKAKSKLPVKSIQEYKCKTLNL